MTAPQEGQRELGRTIDSSRGSLWITTFRKLPIIAPKTPATTYMNGNGIKLKSGRTAVRERCIDRHCIVFQGPCASTKSSALTAFTALALNNVGTFNRFTGSVMSLIFTCPVSGVRQGDPRNHTKQHEMIFALFRVISWIVFFKTRNMTQPFHRVQRFWMKYPDHWPIADRSLPFASPIA